jgi:hypothetical protein
MNNPLPGGVGQQPNTVYRWRAFWRAIGHWLSQQRTGPTAPTVSTPLARPPSPRDRMPQQARLTDAAELAQLSYTMARLAKREGRFGVVSQPQAQRLFRHCVAELADTIAPHLASPTTGYEVVTQFNYHQGVSGVVFYQASTGQVVVTLDGTNDPVEWLTDLATAIDRYSHQRLIQASDLIMAALTWTPPPTANALHHDKASVWEGPVLVVGHSLGGQDAQLGAQHALLQLGLVQPIAPLERRLAMLKFDPLYNPGLENNTQVAGMSLAAVQPRQAVLTADTGVVSSLYPKANVYQIPDPVGRTEPSVLTPVAWAKYHHQLLRYTARGGRIAPGVGVETVLLGEALPIQVLASPDTVSPLSWITVPLQQASDLLNSPWQP